MEKEKYCLYQHIRKTDGVIFYIGIGNKSRPYKLNGRNKYWHNTVKKYGYEITILVDNLTWKKACELEMLMISFYGRKDLGLGNLVNMTDGGQGRYKSKPSEKQRKVLDKTGIIPSENTKNKISNSLKGRPSDRKSVV